MDVHTYVRKPFLGMKNEMLGPQVGCHQVGHFFERIKKE